MKRWYFLASILLVVVCCCWLWRESGTREKEKKEESISLLERDIAPSSFFIVFEQCILYFYNDSEVHL